MPLARLVGARRGPLALEVKGADGGLERWCLWSEDIPAVKGGELGANAAPGVLMEP